MFLSMIPPLGVGGGRSVVNIYIYMQLRTSGGLPKNQVLKYLPV